MRTDREKVFELRRLGHSYKKISKNMGIPTSTLSSWFKHEEWSKEIRDRLAVDVSFSNPERVKRLAEASRKKWEQWHQDCQQEAVQEFPSLKKDPLFLAGLMLYWGEGDRVVKNGIVRLGNSDPEMLKIFYRFLIKSLKLPREQINAWILLYPDLVDSIQKNFWSRTIGMPMGQFKKSITIKGRRPTKRLSYGVCYIYIHSRKLKEKILKWLELSQIYLHAQS